MRTARVGRADPGRHGQQPNCSLHLSPKLGRTRFAHQRVLHALQHWRLTSRLKDASIDGLLEQQSKWFHIATQIMEVGTMTDNRPGSDRGARTQSRSGPQRPALEVAATRVRTETEAKLWQALTANPNRSANDLADIASIGKSTAGKILAKWATEGATTRTPGIAHGGRRAADLWAANDPAPAPNTATEDDATARTAQADSTNDGTPTGEGNGDNEPTGGSTSTNDDKPKASRLAKGALRGMVEDFLRDHAGQDFSPSAIGKNLNRSAGAVHNALEKLVNAGYAVRTSDRPKRFRMAETGQKSNQETPGSD